MGKNHASCTKTRPVAPRLAETDDTLWRIDELTAGLIRSRFVVERRGAHDALLSEREPNQQVHALPCIGRERELGLMTGVFAECVEERSPRAVLIVAPSGGGKSRLVTELCERVHRGEAATQLIAHGDALRTRAAYSLLADLARRAAAQLCGDARAVQQLAQVVHDEAERNVVAMPRALPQVAASRPQRFAKAAGRMSRMLGVSAQCTRNRK